LKPKEIIVMSKKCYNRFICGFYERQKKYPRIGFTLVSYS
jgi:hypothetical protein